MSFEFTKKRYGAGECVWWNRVQLGELSLNITENPNIDWQALRADKTLRLSSKERWNYTFTARLTNGTMVGIFDEKMEAAEAVLTKHRELFLKDSEGKT
tara:strand:- start:3105 stop:3401 length:297 start_codon:yes stop_codon:yes gene_type:complete